MAGWSTINRGFVPDGTRTVTAAWQCQTGQTAVTGLLRVDRTARQPAAIQPSRRMIAGIRAMCPRWPPSAILARCCPSFVDAQTAAGPPETVPPAGPVAGLTVIHFPNNHLVLRAHLVRAWRLLSAGRRGGWYGVSASRDHAGAQECPVADARRPLSWRNVDAADPAALDRGARPARDDRSWSIKCSASACRWCRCCGATAVLIFVNCRHHRPAQSPQPVFAKRAVSRAD